MPTFPSHFAATAEQYGWTKHSTNLFGYWTWYFSRPSKTAGVEHLHIRVRAGRVTALEHSDVQGKSRTFRQAKRQHAFDILTAAPV